VPQYLAAFDRHVGLRAGATFNLAGAARRVAPWAAFVSVLFGI